MTDIPPLSSLEVIPYIGNDGELPDQFQGKVGVYAIFDQDRVLQYVGYSRDIYLSLRQHLVRQPQACYWFKVYIIDRPNRALLEEIQDGWIAENGSVPLGNDPEKEKWSQPIDVKAMLTSAEASCYASAIDEMAQIKVLKQAARRVEADVVEALKSRGLRTEIRFNPKMKESGLLDVK